MLEINCQYNMYISVHSRTSFINNLQRNDARNIVFPNESEKVLLETHLSLIYTFETPTGLKIQKTNHKLSIESSVCSVCLPILSLRTIPSGSVTLIIKVNDNRTTLHTNYCWNDIILCFWRQIFCLILATLIYLSTYNCQHLAVI